MVRPGKQNKDFHDATALANHLGVILAASDSEGINAGRGALPLPCAAGLNWANRPWTKTGQS